MFADIPTWNGDLSGWNFQSAPILYEIFSGTSFDQDLTWFNPQPFVSLHGFLKGASLFNGDVADWDLSNVQDIGQLFESAESFDRSLASWDVSSVTHADGLFKNALSFNGGKLIRVGAVACCRSLMMLSLFCYRRHCCMEHSITH